MRILKTTVQRPQLISSAARICILFALFAGKGWAQTGIPTDCGATVCIEAVFDAGVVYQPPAGQHGITELMTAAAADDLAKVDALLASGAVVNAQDFQGTTALLGASVYGGRELVERLLMAGADPDIADNKGDTPLSMAIQYKNPEAAVAILEHGANPNVYHHSSKPSLRKPVLVRASVLGQTEVVRLLIDRGVDVHESGIEALNAALWRHHEDVAALLVATNVDINAPTYDVKKLAHMQTGERVLQTAAQQGLESSVKLLLRRGADINARNVRGQSALHFTVRENHVAVMTLLLDSGAIVAGNDLAAALDAGQEELALLLMHHLDLATLDTAEIDMLIARADKANSLQILDQLFGVKESSGTSAVAHKLLFASAEKDNCQLFLWDLQDNSQERVFSAAGPCEQKFFVNQSGLALYVVDAHKVSEIALDHPEPEGQPIELPSELIEANLSALRERVRAAYDHDDGSWMTARVVQFGTLHSGQFAFVTHSGGPADETYGYLYAEAGGSWRLIEQKDCHRFDDCRFEQVQSHSISERPGNMTIWHPDVRRNPYFVEKTEAEVIYSEDVGWNGIVTFEIDDSRSLLHYQKGESGHCSGECTYTGGMTLELPGQSAIEIAKFSANNAIVDRYALVWTEPWPQCELIDLGTGQSVFGKLQVAGWIH